jgi:aspartate kinase
VIVLKFGGTSVGGVDQIRRVGRIVKGVLSRRPLIVVSAVGGVTNRLFDLGISAVRNAGWEERLAAIERIHREILAGLDVDPRLVDSLFEELCGLARGISLIRETTPRTRDYLASFGERLSARIVSAHLRSLGIDSQPWDAFDAGLVTDSRFEAARPLPDAPARIRERLGSFSGVPVVTGYIGKDSEGNITTLSRGGSDYSASIFGAALGAEEIQIWTDVDGVMTADPRIVKDARYLKRLSFAEASELAFYGAKVVHPATMIPAVEQNIPIRVLNTWKPDFEGTTIVAEVPPEERGVKSITSKAHVSVVSVVAPRMFLQYGFLARVADVFKRHEVVVDMIATSEVSMAFTTSAAAKLDAAVAELSEFSEVTVRHDMEQISVVGEEIRDRAGFAAQVFDTLRDLNVNIELISYGATRINLSFLVARERAREVVLALHRKLFGT